MKSRRLMSAPKTRGRHPTIPRATVHLPSVDPVRDQSARLGKRSASVHDRQRVCSPDWAQRNPGTAVPHFPPRGGQCGLRAGL